MPRVLHWFRGDLRIHDNPSLYAASQQPESELLTCFIVSPDQWQRHDESAAKLGLVKQQVNALQESLQRLGIPLYLVRGSDFNEEADLICQLLAQLHCDQLNFNEEYGFNERKRDRRLVERLQALGIRANRYRDQSIAPVGSVLTQEGRPYTVFTPFKKRWYSLLTTFDNAPLPAPSCRAHPIKQPAVDLAVWHAVQTRETSFIAGEVNAHHRLATFIDDHLTAYDQQRDFPALDGTSQLSPYLATGILSGRQCLHQAFQLRPHTANPSGIDCWISELIWRDFYIHILYHFPNVSRHRAFKPDTEQLHWQGEGSAFDAWCQGKTGIPIIDAAMRQLLQTGWMHNRLRMICAMFLTKNLFVDWRLGERFFMRHLVDGYLPANNGGWQWSASTGTDAAPYFRIFNPISQSEKFDPQGRFIRHYIPELAFRRDKDIHLPLEHPIPGCLYPLPIVDLKTSRQHAIEAFKALGRTDRSPDQRQTVQSDLFRSLND